MGERWRWGIVALTVALLIVAGIAALALIRLGDAVATPTMTPTETATATATRDATVDAYRTLDARWQAQTREARDAVEASTRTAQWAAIQMTMTPIAAQQAAGAAALTQTASP